ncbi:c-type cytochrome biogenesis protein CcmI [Paracraurococcus ruber]|uniref:C-type cytochrome biogenesis protein CcmI n=1 Tax=Paracraurococcus ruber TaxID=77675 RepID=A0ABS1D283_9PROT|nr:c-type cytochrome biogenesis protein CcmI [Paracraurococcus ruber]MBK1660606.1 c-type cytochrome biogenesis protein CcmI [Paracraurococcus ruber]TDG29223.1 c-type cytochrome biogenesis protein CcmI [Paracraurococcus ruber]
MTWFPFWPLVGLLALAALAPLAVALISPPRARGRREADLGLYRAQMAELEREKAAGRLDDQAYRAAQLEVQRRLLAAPEDAGPAITGTGRKALLATLFGVPALALGLYVWGGIPEMPSATFAMREEAAMRDELILAQLRDRLTQLPPNTDQARQGWALLAKAERDRGNLVGAADAYRRAMFGKFDAETAAQLAQVLLEDGKIEDAGALLRAALPQAPQHIGLRFLAGMAEARAGRNDSARAAWRALIADAPPEAPWRAMVERRMNELP